MWRGLGSMNKGPNATIRLVRRQNHAGTTVSWTTVQREKNSHAYKLSSNVQTACSTDSLNNCPKHSILRFSSFALKIYLWLKMCQHNLPCSIVLPTACFPEGPSPHFTLCSFWRRRPRLEAVNIAKDTKKFPIWGVYALKFPNSRGMGHCPKMVKISPELHYYWRKALQIYLH